MTRIVEKEEYFKMDTATTEDAQPSEAPAAAKDGAKDEEGKSPVVAPKPKKVKTMKEIRDQEFKKVLNEMEVRFRRDEPASIKEKRKRQLLNKGRTRKVAVLVSGKGSIENGSLVIGAVFHVLSENNTGEFDPFYVERIKNALQLMRNKNFVEALAKDVKDNTFKDRASVPDLDYKFQQDILQATQQQRVSVVPQEKVSPQLNDFLRKPLQAVNLGLQPLDPLSNTILRTQVYEPRISDVTGHSLPKNMMQQVDEEFKLATISLQQIMGAGSSAAQNISPLSRQRSSSPRNHKRRLIAAESQGESIRKVEPIFDQMSGLNIYHYAVQHGYNASIVARNTEASPEWFTAVQREIYGYYSQLQSQMTEQEETKPEQEQKECFQDIMEYIDNHISQNKIGNIKSSNFAKRVQGLQVFKIWEQGTQVDVPITKGQQQKMLKLQIVCRLIQTQGEQTIVAEGDEDNSTSPGKRTMLFLAFECQSAKQQSGKIADISSLAYKLSLMNFY